MQRLNYDKQEDTNRLDLVRYTCTQLMCIARLPPWILSLGTMMTIYDTHLEGIT